MKRPVEKIVITLCVLIIGLRLVFDLAGERYARWSQYLDWIFGAAIILFILTVVIALAGEHLMRLFRKRRDKNQSL